MRLKSIVGKIADVLTGQPSRHYHSAYPTTTTYVHPASHGYPQTEHEIVLTYATRVTKWPRFWIPNRVTEGYEVRVDDPPRYRDPCPDADSSGTTGIYGIFIPNAMTLTDAIGGYVREVSKRRNQYG